MVVGGYQDTVDVFRSIAVSSGAVGWVPGNLRVHGSSIASVARGGWLWVGGNLLGTTQNPALFQPLGTVNLYGGGTATAPQLLEAMSEDLGPVPAGFTGNFAYGSLNLSNTDYVRLVNRSDNAPGGGPEAVYADRLVVPAGTTLDLNGLNLYVRDAVVGGKIVGGKIAQIPNSGALTVNTPTSGNISVGGELDGCGPSSAAGGARSRSPSTPAAGPTTGRSRRISTGPRCSSSARAERSWRPPTIPRPARS